jgi:hypothetical protein
VDTESETDEVWSWFVPPLDHFGWFSDLSGRAPDDVIATGYFPTTFLVFDPFIVFNGQSAHYSYPAGYPDLQGTGICASGSGAFHLGAIAGNPPHTPRFFSQQADWWEEIGPPAALCTDGSWLPYLSSDLSARSISCLEPEGFAALAACYVPPEGPPPGETVIYLLIHEGEGWTVPYAHTTNADGFPSPGLWGQSADDLFVFVAETNAPGYHFDGVGMTPITPPPGNWFFNADGGIKAMDGSRESEGKELGYWLAGTYSPNEVGPFPMRGFVWRSPDGMVWNDVEVPPPDSSECSEYFNDLWISNQDEVFVVGVRFCPAQNENGSENLPTLLRFDGEVWEEITVPQHPLLTGEARGDLQRIWGTDGAIFVAAVMQLAGHDIPSLLRYQPY